MAELTPGRRRMIEDMTIRNLSPALQRSLHQRGFEVELIFRPVASSVDVEDIRAFEVHLAGTGISWPGLNQDRVRVEVLLRRDARPHGYGRCDGEPPALIT